MGTMMAKTDVVVGIIRIGQNCPKTTQTLHYQGKMARQSMVHQAPLRSA